MKEKAMQDVDRFDQWLKEKIKSVHYANSAMMSEPYNIVYENSLKLQKHGKFTEQITG